MTARNCLLAGCVAVALSGCGNDGGGGEPDIVDAWADEAADAEPETPPDGDGEVSSGDDSGALDQDGDTYPDDVDCDDYDPLVIPGSVRACASDCATGEERCVAGSWTECSAPSDCTCDTPGTTRTVVCGNCGLASQRCGTDGMWEDPGACMSEGECGDGEVETEPCIYCGSRSRICDATCTWRPWGDCDPPNDCDPSSPPEVTNEGCALGEVQRRACSSDCAWIVTVPCTADCMLPPRPAANLNDEICIPGGTFLMGTDIAEHVAADNTPVHTVGLTPYYIDKYKVTNRRYRACVDAGVCMAPPPAPLYSTNEVTYHFEPIEDWQDYPVSAVTYDQAVAFCAWDGGRLLPTEAQWEKAAKGPEPRQVPYAWGTDPDPCPYVNACLCLTSHPDPADDHRAGASFYGVFQMDANYFDRVRDWYDPGYYATSPTSDPIGPATGTYRTFRGASYHSCSASSYPSVARRDAARPDVIDSRLGFRCSRPGY